MTAYDEKKQRLIALLSTGSEGAIGLDKDTSNLFRDRQKTPQKRLNVRDFNQVLRVDTQAGWVEVEGMTTYQDLVAATLAHGVMPAVVPELKSITIGGAVSGIGIESSSFKYGLVHETILELEVLNGDGQTRVCTPDNEYKDLFYGFPNSYGTLGYVLRLKAKTVPVKPYVKLTHIPYQDAKTFFRDLHAWCQRKEEVDFIDGTVFAPNEYFLTLGSFVDETPFTSDYTYTDIYYRSIPRKETDYLTVEDYIWRWDTDWFWCSKNLFAQNPLIRRLAGRRRLNSITYTKIMRWNSTWGLTKRLDRLLGRYPESVIQDVDIPIANAPDFLEFFQREIDITPVWICPVQAYNPQVRFDLFSMDPTTVYVNFGFWDVINNREKRPAGYYNRLVEDKVAELGGIKSLYSDVYYSQEAFWENYNKSVYDRLKTKYDPQSRFKDLYQKTVLKN